MAKSKKKMSKFDHLNWKPVEVTLGDPSLETPNKPEDLDWNHYDSEEEGTSGRRHKGQDDDMPVQPGEKVGMMYQLEVLPSNQYRVVNGALVPATVENNQTEAATQETGESANQRKEKKSTKNSKEDKQSKRQKKRRKQEASLDDNDDTPTDESATSLHQDALQEPQQQAAEVATKTKQLKHEKSSKRKREEISDLPTSTVPEEKTAAATATEPKKKKKKKKEKTTTNPPSEEQRVTPTHQEVESFQTNWRMATAGVTLLPEICAFLCEQNYSLPTPIQAATLAPAIYGRRNIVGAAPTGSGKTLAYLLPILQSLFSTEKEESPRLRALILTPTRELALQVSRECGQLCRSMAGEKRAQTISCGTIVGGLAHAKQVRILQINRPAVIVATPGRLWEMMSKGEYEHLVRLEQMQFLVIDEADRMIQQNSFRELVQIFDAIHQANPMEDSDDESEKEDGFEEQDDDELLLGLPGIPGEAKVQMLGDLEQMQQRQETPEEPEPIELDDDDYRRLEKEQDRRVDVEMDEILLPAAPPVQRQTFVFSATLMLPPSAAFSAKASVAKKKKGKRSSKHNQTVDGAIAEILEKSRARGRTKVIDLTSGDAKKSESGPNSAALANTPVSSRLPTGLSLYKIECTQRHKDSHLYAYLVTTAQGASGPCLVFCNSIAAVRRVGATLQALRLPVRTLHANMAQKARFKAVEMLREPNSRAIVVATDVAARGLDIPTVSTVVHYDVARQVDTFIHRAGRTARGVGQGAVGSSVSLIAPGEDKAHDKVCEALHSKRLFEPVPLDGRLLAAAQERASLATKIVACEDAESKTQTKNRWFQEAAEEAGLDLDEDLIDEGLAGGDLREQQQLREARQAKVRLRQLLAQPMQTQRFGKFLSSNSAAVAGKVAPYVVPLQATGKKRRRRAKK